MGFLTDNFISSFFVSVINFFYSFTGDYVVSMLLFALAVRIVLLPLDIKSKKSTLKTQLVQPKINAIKQRYKNDPEKQSIALRNLYKEENIKMSAGCLPMLLQLPILFAMFGAIRQLADTQSIQLVVGLANGQEIMPPSFMWIRNIWQADAGHVAVMPSFAEFTNAVNACAGKLDAATLAAAKNVVNLTAVNSFAGATATLTDATLLGGMFSEAYASIPADVVASAAGMNFNTVVAPVLEAHAGFNNGYYVLPFLAFGTQWAATRQQTKQQAMTTGSIGDSNMMMEWLMPLMIGWFAMTTGSLFAVYWVFGNLWMLGQNIIMNMIIKKKLAEQANQPAKK
ncbi:MAG: YidC/Oxa1 family membrane protein insertase [Clostridiales bacterium]|nr:YidC/Oxa1 family membrane protein insertase [Clostridiales bacterium]